MITRETLLQLLHDEIDEIINIRSVGGKDIDFPRIAHHITCYWLNDDNDEIKYTIYEHDNRANIYFSDYNVRITLEGSIGEDGIPTYSIVDMVE